MSDNDDLRFGDIDGGNSDDADSGGSGGFTPEPLLVGGMVAMILLISQPLSGLTMNVGMAVFLLAAGVFGSFGV